MLIPMLVGFVGSFFTIASVHTWYAALTKPWFNPPSWLFAPVWTLLYILMGISFWMIWESRSKMKARAMWMFAVQLVLNAIWTPIFFGAHATGIALGVIVLMWMAIAFTMFLFYRISKTAAWLLAPYLLWVTFATCLNFAVWKLNV